MFVSMCVLHETLEWEREMYSFLLIVLISFALLFFSFLGVKVNCFIQIEANFIWSNGGLLLTLRTEILSLNCLDDFLPFYFLSTYFSFLGVNIHSFIQIAANFIWSNGESLPTLTTEILWILDILHFLQLCCYELDFY